LGMIHFSRSAAKITAAGSEGGGVVTMRSLGAMLEGARLRKKKKKKKKREDGRWEEETQGVLAARNPTP
jgi:hypothetical protein